jgi:Mce-associated membrane protein
VPSFRRRASVLDADRVDRAPEEPDRATGVAEAKALAEQAEAEAAEAEAIAAAARARSKAIRLRRQARAAEAEPAEAEPAEADTATEDVADAITDLDEGDTVDEAAEADDTEEAGTAYEAEPIEASTKPKRRRWPLGPILKILAASLAIICAGVLVTLSVLMVINHRQQAADHQRSAEYAAAARQSVVTLMSLDFNRAQEDVQRIIDNSTGQFKEDFQNQSADFVKVAQDSKVVTEVTVNATAVESMSDDSAVVLVAATSRVTNAAGAKQEPRPWRLSVSLQRDGGQIKMSKVEFVP